MKLVFSPPKFGFVVMTRVALAFGAGLLVAQRLPDERRRMIGKTLVAIGVVTTIPAALFLSHSRRPAHW